MTFIFTEVVILQLYSLYEGIIYREEKWKESDLLATLRVLYT